MSELLPASLVPVPAGPILDADANGDPRLAAFARAFADAVVSTLSPWLDRLGAALGRETPVLLSADEARSYCGGLAKSIWCDFDQRGVIPSAVRVGGRVFWRRSDLDAWVDRSCPGRARFEESQAAQKNHPAKRGSIVK